MAYTIPRVTCRLTLKEEEIKYMEDAITGPEAAVRIVRPLLETLDRECVAVVNLDTGLKPINWNIVSIGGTFAAQVEIANIFKTAILSNAAKIMAFHNHPSGKVEPSDEDREITERIRMAGELLGIPLVDHIIIAAGKNGYYSLMESEGLS